MRGRKGDLDSEKREAERAEVSLTGRRRQIVTIMARGKTSGEIAEELKLSRRTVEAHRARVTRSIGIRSTAAVMAWLSAEMN